MNIKKNIKVLTAVAGVAGLSGCYTVPVETQVVATPVATPAPVVVAPVVAPAPVVVRPAWGWGPYWRPYFHGPRFHGPHFHGHHR